MFPQQHFKLTRIAALLAAAYATLPASAYAIAAGRVDFVAGTVVTVDENGVERQLAKGAEVNSGDAINTEQGGRAQIRFTDGAYVSLQPNTQFRVDDYNYENKTDGNEKGFFSLLKGGLRAISGAIGHINRDKYRVATPAATIGIRGTGYNVALSDGLSVSVTDGRISLTNAGGSLIISQGQSAFVANENTAPVLTFEQPSTPPASISSGADQVADKPAEVISTETTEGAAIATVVQVGVGSVLAGSLPDQLDGSEGFLQSFDTEPDDTAFFSGNNIKFYLGISATDLTDLSAATADNGVYNGIPASGFDGIINWQRFTGIITHTDFDGAEGGGEEVIVNNLNANQGLHGVVGIPTADMPVSGSLQYALIGATRPTLSSGAVAPGTVTGGFLNVYFGNYSVNGGLDIDMAGTTLNVNYGGSISGSAFSGSGSGFGTGCASSCYVNVAGFFAGASAARAGVAYQIDNTSFGDGSSLFGAAAFTKTALPAPE